MKKKLSKNYIAFTLTEMTMVLLIMSVIAAVSAPLVKHAVSDVTNNSVGIPTKLWGKVNGLAGIHNLNGDAGIVSVGTIPSGDPINYNNPALMIQTNVNNTSQIGFYSIGYRSFQNLVMDKSNNISFGSGRYNNSETFNSIELGKMTGDSVYGNYIHVGKELADQPFEGPSLNLNKEIRIGYKTEARDYGGAPYATLLGNTSGSGGLAAVSIEVAYSSSCGYGNTRYYFGKHPLVYVNGGDGFTEHYFTQSGSVNIGQGYGSTPYQERDSSFQNIRIGNYAGAMLEGDSSLSVSTHRKNTVNIGKYAGALLNGVHDMSESVSIGLSALGPMYYQNSNTYAMGYANNSVAIGSFTNAYVIKNYVHNVIDSVSIGTYAGMYSSTRNISIGEFAGNFKKEPYQDVKDNIAIGFYAGLASGIPSDLIAIGNYAGAYSSSVWHRLYIGTYAGYKSGASLAIGKYACANSWSEAAVCIGQFPKEYIDANIHKKYVSDREMLLYSHSGGRIFLVAKKVYAPGAINQISSDVRLKRKISLAPYSIKDFKKFNIYNFSLKYDKDHLKHIGVMAQEYRKAFPLAIVKGGKYLSIQPDWLYYSMINAVKDLDKLVQEFQVKLDEYVNNFESIKSRISTLEQSVAEEKQNNANMRKELEQINAQLLAKTKNK